MREKRSEDVTCRLWNGVGSNNLWILSLVQCPELFRTLLLHFNLDVVLTDFILAHNKLTWIFDQHTSIGFLNNVGNDVG